MAGIFRCRLSLRSLISLALKLCFLVKLLVHKGKRLWNILHARRYTISFGASILLGFLNILTFKYGCQIQSALFNPVKLYHGHIPVFPKHFFHGPETGNISMEISESVIENHDKLDAYLYSQRLRNSLSAPTTPSVHIVWCDSGPFTFTHYLSVLAAFKVISPSILYLHLIRQPDIDPDGYFQFLPDLLRDLPPLITKTLVHTDACYGSYEDKMIAYMNLLGTLGGVVINRRTIFAPSPILTSMMNSKMSHALEDKTLEPLILTVQANVLNNIPNEDYLQAFLQEHSMKYLECRNVTTFSLLSHFTCVYIHADIYPVDIFNGSSHFDYLARWIAYGTSRRLLPKPADSVIVPNIVHYVWLGQRELEFFAYLSVISSVYVLKADIVYIHGNYKPLGNLWMEVEKIPKVKFIHRDFPSTVFGEPIKKFASHASDYLRGDVLLRYGGVYSDWDVIFLQELPHSLRLHNTTATVDWPETGAFPDVFNLGVLISAPGAPFLRYFLESYRWYLDDHWSYNAIHMPYKVYEKQPLTLNVDRHLQILCAQNKCHATWLQGYKEESANHLSSDKVNWRKDALAIHWTYPDPDEFTSKAHLLASETITGEIGKYVLKQAKLIS